jgi:hypothetical protein
MTTGLKNENQPTDCPRAKAPLRQFFRLFFIGMLPTEAGSLVSIK